MTQSRLQKVSQFYDDRIGQQGFQAGRLQGLDSVPMLGITGIEERVQKAGVDQRDHGVSVCSYFCKMAWATIS